MRYRAIIDPHVHLRGDEYEQDFASMALEDCTACGVKVISEMPNPQPNLVNWASTQFRTSQIRGRKYPVQTLINVGLTKDRKQVENAAKMVMKFRDYYLALKMFTCNSTGDMGIIDPRDQQMVWKTLVKAGYDGVVMLHCEDESEWYTKYDPANPISHSLRQNPESEYLQVEQQLKFARDAGFGGTFYVCHVSNPATIILTRSSRLQVAVEVTWHHIFLNFEDYETLGNLVKINPPLRSKKMQESLLDKVLEGDVDLIATDHAPHPLALKRSIQPPSGIPALPFWPKGIEKLRKLKIPLYDLDCLTGGNISLIFQHDFDRPMVDMKYNPTLWDKYGWNPFARVDRDN